MASASAGTADMKLKQRLLALTDLKTDAEALHRHFMFIRDKDLDISLSQQGSDVAWAVRLARKYYDRLNKTYVLVDLSRYTTQQVGMRWRTAREVSAGKGQFICGAVHCSAARHLASLEVPFSYKEHGTTRHALVKARLCPLCTQKLLAASPKGSRGATQPLAEGRVQAVLRAADAASPPQPQRQPATASSAGAASRKRGRSGDESEQGGVSSAKAPRQPGGASHDAGCASRRHARSPSAASAASGGSKGGASVSSAALKGLSDEELLRRLLK